VIKIPKFKYFDSSLVAMRDKEMKIELDGNRLMIKLGDQGYLTKLI
jgi:hypothetical protein